jgi:pimeloyl-ACP methyl ester carboxylesterase
MILRSLLLALLVACSPDRPRNKDDQDDSGKPDDSGELPDSEDSEDSGHSGETGDSTVDLPVPHEAGCDDLVPTYCAYPFPSDALLTADPSTPTGLRLALQPAMLPGDTARFFDFAPYDRLDGVSPSTQILTLLPRNPDLGTAASQHDIGRSLEPDSPTVILDLESGVRVAHWVELDARAEDPERTTLYLRLASRLEEGHRYAVALRDLRDAEGAPVEPFDAFRALRDGLRTDSLALEARRPSYEAMFATLEAWGIERDALVSAWWFGTASGDSIRRDMLHIRADALDRLGEEGIGCTVSVVEEPYRSDGLTFRRIRGTYTVPSYVDSPSPPARFVRGADGLPEFVGYVEIPFSLLVPSSIVDGGPRSAPLVTFGHGLLGNSEDYLAWSDIRRMAWAAESVMVATDWDGMSWEDIPVVASALSDPSYFTDMAERLQQGMVQQLALTRTFSGVCRAIPELTVDGVELVDPERRTFVGVSQGAILGATYMALSPDVERGVLLVGGANFPFMIERSIDFSPYFPYFAAAWPDRLDQAFILALAEILWEHSEASGYAPFLGEGLPGIGPRSVLMIAALNDAQVPNLASDMLARMLGATIVRGSAREVWGLDVVDAPIPAPAYVTVDMGDPPVPEGNLAPSTDAGGHPGVCLSDTALSIMRAFIEEGAVTMPCEGVCDPD